MTELIQNIIKFCRYLFSKRSELNDLDYRDALLARTNIRIYRKMSFKTDEWIPLKELKYIHKLERKNAQEKLQERIEILQKNKDNILIENRVSKESMAVFMPSISGIRVVKAKDNQYFAFEGNGRIAALRSAFADDHQIMIEVEEFHFKNPRGIVRKLRQLRKINGLMKGEE